MHSSPDGFAFAPRVEDIEEGFLSTNELLSADLVLDEAPVERCGDEWSPLEDANRVQGGVFTDADRLSAWSRSASKRVFDLVCVLCALPLVVPVLLLVALAVRCTSRGPVFFRQERMGCNGQTFMIMKFRTMVCGPADGSAVTTASDDRFTVIGPFLRKWKLDEVPQLLNVVAGEMSLVGPRPKVPEHEPNGLCCRPGITGAATLAFAREELALDQIPRHRLQDFYSNVVLPAKRRIDMEYMKRATFLSDLALVCNSVLGRWNSDQMEAILEECNAERLAVQSKPPASVRGLAHRVPVAMGVMEVRSAEGESL